MDEKRASVTALATFIRAYHATHDAPKIFDDPLAHRLLPEEARAALERHTSGLLQRLDPLHAASCPDQATALARVMRMMAGPPIVLSRARYTEETLEQAIGRDVKQYVILGAGMDTFAFRRAADLRQLQVFEVDHPATQAFKRRRIAELGWEEPAQLHFVPVDFTREDLAEALARSPYDPRAPGFFSWLGVTYYLPRDAVMATLRAVAGLAPRGSEVVFDYLDTDAFDPLRVAKRVQAWSENVRNLGEPLMGGLAPPSLAADLAELGLRLRESLSPADIQRRFIAGRTDGYQACEHVHFACAEVGGATALGERGC